MAEVNNKNTIDIENFKIDRCLFLNKLDKDIKNKKNQDILKHKIEKEEQEMNGCTFTPESKESIKRKFKEKIRKMNSKTIEANHNKRINQSMFINKKKTKENKEKSIEKEAANKNINTTENNEESEMKENLDENKTQYKSALLSDLRQITEEESTKKSFSIKNKKDYFNWDHYTKYVLSRRNKLSTIEEEQIKQAKLPGSGNIWKNHLTVPESVNLKTNRNFDNVSHLNNHFTINRSIGTETIYNLNSFRNVNNELSMSNLNSEKQKFNNVKEILNFYSNDAIKFEGPIEYNSAIQLLHEELNKIKLELD